MHEDASNKKLPAYVTSDTGMLGVQMLRPKIPMVVACVNWSWQTINSNVNVGVNVKGSSESSTVARM